MEVNHLYGVEWNSLTPEEKIQANVQMNNAWSAEQAQKQMDFQREMSNTSHQREVADLKAAGLNPVLSAKLGGASTPSGAMGTTDTSGTSALIDLLGLSMQAANSAANAAYGATISGNGNSASGTSIFGLNPSNYKFKNPRGFGQLAWNAAMDLFGSTGINIGMDDILALASGLGIDIEGLITLNNYGSDTSGSASGQAFKSTAPTGSSRFFKKPDGPLLYFVNGLRGVVDGSYKDYEKQQKSLASAWMDYVNSKNNGSNNGRKGASR